MAARGAEESLPKDWRLEAEAINDRNTAAAAIETLVDRNIDVVWTQAGVFSANETYDGAIERVLLLAAMRHKVPVFGDSRGLVRAGALLGIEVSPGGQGRGAAELVDRLLRGDGSQVQARRRAQPADEGPATEYQVSVNLVVADALSIQLPKELVVRAANVFRAEPTGSPK